MSAEERRVAELREISIEYLRGTSPELYVNRYIEYADRQREVGYWSQFFTSSDQLIEEALDADIEEVVT